MDRQQRWYRLDNTAIMYAAIRRANFSNVYRLSALMREKIDPKLFQRAVNLTLPRFPMLDVRLRRGFFWQYLDNSGAPEHRVRPDTAYPCAPLREMLDESDLLRFFYYENRISVEIFHVLADGDGGLRFFKTILAVYLRLQGIDIPVGYGVEDLNAPFDPEEAEDAYLRYSGKGPARRVFAPPAYRFMGKPLPFYTLRVTRGLLPLDRILEAARSHGASITEYLAAVLIECFITRQDEEDPWRKKPVALAVPVNLRALFPSRTVKNFILSLRPNIDPAIGDYSFPEIIKKVHHQMRLGMDKNELQSQIAGVIKFAANPVLQLLPLVIKEIGVDLIYRLTGDRQYSTTMTNPGRIDFPPEMEPHILQIEAMLGAAYSDRPTCSVTSNKNTLTILFASTIEETLVERDFFRRLVRDGIPVSIESNIMDKT